MQLIKEKEQMFDGNLIQIERYTGVCHICNTPVEYDGKILVVKLYEDDNIFLCGPLTNLTCPSCHSKIESMVCYKSMDITQELLSLKEK